MVLFSFRPPNADYLGFPATTEGIVESACKSEEQGFDACMVNDHILVQNEPQMVTYFANTYDPLMVLAYIAAKTSRIRLGTSVMIMPYRNPMNTAKMFATLDQMSGGRAIAGVGAGGNEAEYERVEGALPREGRPHQRVSQDLESVLGAGDHHIPRGFLRFRGHARRAQTSAAASPGNLGRRFQPGRPSPGSRIRPGVGAHTDAAAGFTPKHGLPEESQRTDRA